MHLRFLNAYGGAILIVHFAVFYLLSYHTKTWACSVRAGYLLNQVLLRS